MCPACYSALILLVAGVATTGVGGTATFAVAKQMRQERKQKRIQTEKDK